MKRIMKYYEATIYKLSDNRYAALENNKLGKVIVEEDLHECKIMIDKEWGEGLILEPTSTDYHNPSSFYGHGQIESAAWFTRDGEFVRDWSIDDNY